MVTVTRRAPVISTDQEHESTSSSIEERTFVCLEELIEGAEFLYFTRVVEPDTGETRICLSIRPTQGPPEFVSGEDVIECLSGVGGGLRKVCGRCGEEKVLLAFCKKPTAKDGRNSYCRRCESQRVSDSKKRSDERKRQQQENTQA